MESEPKEFYVKAPWGKIALISWYEGPLKPVLMVHGRQDTAATFIPLIAQLPRTRSYVAIELPGSGKSDHLPQGLMMTRFHYLSAIDIVVRHLGWKSFIYMGHSMGCELGLFYNAVCPGLITSFIHLDPGPSFQRLQQPDHVFYYNNFYHKYFSNYKRYTSGNGRIYTKKQALAAVMKARKFTEEQAEIILSRSLVSIGEDQYRLAWDPRAKFVTPPNLPNEYNSYLFTTNIPTLFICMSHGFGRNLRGKVEADQLVENMMAAGNIKKVDLVGGHDHHIDNTDEVAKYVVDFLNKRVEVRSKL